MRFRKKPVVIEAMQYDGTNHEEIVTWMGRAPVSELGPGAHWAAKSSIDFVIQTPEGAMRVTPGDWVIRGIKGEWYPCKPDIFEATYDPA